MTASRSTSPAAHITLTERPSELDDPIWLTQRLRHSGQRAIAAELGVGRQVVRTAVERFAIKVENPRRRRGITNSTQDFHFATAPANGELILNGSLAALQARFSEDQHHRTPPSRETLIARCQAWLDAERNHEPAASQDALLSIASAALLIHEHQNKLRRWT